MLVESFLCPACGGPKTVKPDAAIIYCDFCDSIVAYDATRERPTTAHDAKHAARTLRWYAASTAMTSLVATDPEASARYTPVQAATMGLANSATPPNDRATVLLAAWRVYYAWIRTRLPEHAATIVPEVFARSMLRSSLRAIESLLGDGGVARVRHDVLGDLTIQACASCGGTLEGDGLGACPHCGAVARVEVDDPWTVGVLALWPVNEQNLVRDGKLDTLEAPMAALQLALMSVTTGMGKVSPEALVRVLTHMIPWVPKFRVVEAIQTLAAWAVPAAKIALTGARPLVEKTWKPDAARRPR